MNVTLRAMTIDDYPEVMSLWRQTEGVGLTESDSEEGIDAFLRRNPGMSAVAVAISGELLGAVLCGHDGRRGYLHHLAVVPSAENRGWRPNLSPGASEALQIRVYRSAMFPPRQQRRGQLFLGTQRMVTQA